MKNQFLYCTVLLALLACSAPSGHDNKKTEDVPVLDSLLHRYHEERLHLFPMDATMAGDNRFNNLLPNVLTAQFRHDVKDLFTRTQKSLEQYDRTKLSEDEQISYDVLTWECDMALKGLVYRDNLMPINQFSSLHLWMGQLGSGASIQPFGTVKDYDDWLSRLNGYTAWCDTAIANMRRGMRDGYVIPKALAKKVIPQLADFDHGPVERHLFYEPVKHFPDGFSADDKTRLTQAYASAIGTMIIPAYKRLKDFIANEYLPACRETSGIDAVPHGREQYQYLIKLHTTTDMSADEIFALGKREVDRISVEMEAVKKQVGFTGDLKSFFNHLRTKKELMPFTKPEQVLENFNAIHDKIKPNLRKLFDKAPITPFEVRRTEAFREASASAEYNPGSQDGTRPGIFYVPITDVKKYNLLSDEDLFLHEAIPGHHYQISLQLENTALPAFRRILSYSAYAEGWALYTESLGKELGLYTDPYQYFGMLSAEMHRAIRLVVDAGMHTQGWTREQAIQYSKDHEAEPKESIVAEIERYMSIPGQALSYKTGQLKILELRAKAERELGDKFNIAQFHDQVLNPGCIPLTVLEQKINRWIETVKK